MYYDSITGLPVRTSFMEFITKMCSAREEGRFAILSLNIGSFHRINQIYGRREGNAVLALLAQRLVRSHDYMLSACRTEADSFLVLLDAELLPTVRMETQLREDCEEFINLLVEKYPKAKLSMQCGICLLTREIPSFEKAFEYAQTARCDVAVGTGLFYHEALDTLRQGNRLLPLFENMTDKKHLIIYLQPKFCTDETLPVGAEALVRIMDTNGRLLKPASFLPVLEKYKLAGELDLMVMETILQLLSGWQHHGMEPVPISINVTCSDFGSREFMRIFKDITEKYEDALPYLEFEMDAGAYYADMGSMENVVASLHHLGCKVSLDSFGGNTLTVGNLEIAPVNAVKFNRCLLQTSMRSPNNYIVLQKLAEMFEQCGIVVVCEGIENEAEAAFVERCGVRYVQGYYYGRPVPFDIFQKKYMLTTILQ